jgi:hypothetical protein
MCAQSTPVVPLNLATPILSVSLFMIPCECPTIRETLHTSIVDDSLSTSFRHSSTSTIIEPLKASETGAGPCAQTVPGNNNSTAISRLMISRILKLEWIASSRNISRAQPCERSVEKYWHAV